jgi:hypothetical protein
MGSVHGRTSRVSSPAIRPCAAMVRPDAAPLFEAREIKCAVHISLWSADMHLTEREKSHPCQKICRVGETIHRDCQDLKESSDATSSFRLSFLSTRVCSVCHRSKHRDEVLKRLNDHVLNHPLLTVVASHAELGLCLTLLVKPNLSLSALVIRFRVSDMSYSARRSFIHFNTRQPISASRPQCKLPQWRLPKIHHFESKTMA